MCIAEYAINNDSNTLHACQKALQLCEAFVLVGFMHCIKRIT